MAVHLQVRKRGPDVQSHPQARGPPEAGVWQWPAGAEIFLFPGSVPPQNGSLYRVTGMLLMMLRSEPAILHNLRMSVFQI